MARRICALCKCAGRGCGQARPGQAVLFVKFFLCNRTPVVASSASASFAFCGSFLAGWLVAGGGGWLVAARKVQPSDIGDTGRASTARHGVPNAAESQFHNKLDDWMDAFRSAGTNTAMILI